MYLIANIIVCVCAIGGFVYGGAQFFRPKKALYAQMITLSLGCIAFGRIFNIVRLLTGGSLTDGFSLGFLGMIGSLMFFFSANYGTVDSIVDEGLKQYKNYRLLALAAPFMAAVMYVGLFLVDTEMLFIYQLLGAVLMVFIMLASYYHMKHMIFPDVDFGVGKCLRPYNLLGLLYAGSIFVEFYALSQDNELFTLIICIVTGLIISLMIPTIVRGIKKWTT